MKYRLSDLALVELEENMNQGPPPPAPKEQEVNIDTVKDPDAEEPEPDPQAQPSPPQQGEDGDNKDDKDDQGSGGGSSSEDKDEEAGDEKGDQQSSGGGSSAKEEEESEEDSDDQSGGSSEEKKDDTTDEDEEGAGSSSAKEGEDDKDEDEQSAGSSEEKEGEDKEGEKSDGADSTDGAEDEPALKETDLDPGKPEYNDQRKALDKLQKAMQQAEENKTAPQALSDELRDKVESLAQGESSPGGYKPGKVVDNVTQMQVDRRSMANGESYRQAGLQMMGSAGQKFKDLVQAEQSRKVIANQRRGRRLDAHALYRTKYATPSDPPRIFKDILPGRAIDCAVSIGVDNSSSMSRGKIEVASKLSCAIGSLLQGLKVPCEIVGYSGTSYGDRGAGRASATLIVGQAFGETFQAARCVFPAQGGTPDAAVVEFCIPRLMARPEVKKIYFMIQDGDPDDQAQAVWCKAKYKELREQGVHVFGFGIDADLSRIFGDKHWMYVSTSQLDSFPSLFINKLRSLMLPQT